MREIDGFSLVLLFNRMRLRKICLRFLQRTCKTKTGLGRVDDGVLTVRFTHRTNKIRIIGAGYWRKERKIYEREIKYTNEPTDKVRVIDDFLPSPEELALKEETVKVTISLSKASIEFFKKEAKKHISALSL